MATILKLTKMFALVKYSKAALENYNPSIVLESDDIEELENLDTSDYVNEGPTCGCTIVEKKDEGIYDYYSGDVFEMNSYN